MQTDVKIIELAIEQHVDLADDRLFGRSPVEADGALDLVTVHRGLDRQGRTQGTAAQATVTAGMAGLAGLQWRPHGFGLL